MTDHANPYAGADPGGQPVPPQSKPPDAYQRFERQRAIAAAVAAERERIAQQLRPVAATLEYYDSRRARFGGVPKGTEEAVIVRPGELLTLARLIRVMLPPEPEAPDADAR